MHVNSPASGQSDQWYFSNSSAPSPRVTGRVKGGFPSPPFTRSPKSCVMVLAKANGYTLGRSGWCIYGIVKPF